MEFEWPRSPDRPRKERHACIEDASLLLGEAWVGCWAANAVTNPVDFDYHA